MMLRAVQHGLSLGEFTVARTARQYLDLIESGEPLCSETTEAAKVFIRATVRYAEMLPEVSHTALSYRQNAAFVRRLKQALATLEGCKMGQRGPKPKCMCEPCVTHRTANRKWHEDNKERRLKYNRDRQRRIRAGQRDEEIHIWPGEPSDEELDRLAEESLRAQGFRT